MIHWPAITVLLAAALVVMIGVVWQLQKTALNAKREKTIRSFIFSEALFQKLREQHPHLTVKDCQLVAHALRDFFVVYIRSGFRFIGMPSRVVDDLWHAFILDTRAYTKFCNEAFGRYFHHVPAGTEHNPPSRDPGLQLTWRYACLNENIDPKAATRLPLLFAIDRKLKIADGFSFSGRPPARKRGADGCSGGCGGGGGGGGGDGFACSGGSCSGGCGGGCGGGGD